MESWVQGGEEVEVTKRGTPVFKIVPFLKSTRRIPRVDFQGMLKEIWGDRVLDAEAVRQMRDLARGERS